MLSILSARTGLSVLATHMSRRRRMWRGRRIRTRMCSCVPWTCPFTAWCARFREAKLCVLLVRQRTRGMSTWSSSMHPCHKHSPADAFNENRRRIYCFNSSICFRRSCIISNMSLSIYGEYKRPLVCHRNNVTRSIKILKQNQFHSV